MGKDFKSGQDPNSFFFSAPDETPGKAPEEASKRETKKAEGKTKRVQLVVRPSLYDAIKKKADQEETSVNALITQAVKKYLEEV